MFIMNVFNRVLDCGLKNYFLLNSKLYYLIERNLLMSKSGLEGCFLLILNYFLNQQVMVWVYFK